jgi:nitrogen regulatory protein P-II 1
MLAIGPSDKERLPLKPGVAQGTSRHGGPSGMSGAKRPASAFTPRPRRWCLPKSCNVKKLEAIIKPFKLAEVKEALAELGIEGITVCEVKGYQPMNGAPVGSAHLSDLHPKFKIEVVVPATLIDRAVRSVLAAARTGLVGDGKVFVSPIEQAIRIRTEETGLAAI